MMQLLVVSVSQYVAYRPAFVVSPSAFHSVFSLCVHADDHWRRLLQLMILFYTNHIVQLLQRGGVSRQ